MNIFPDSLIITLAANEKVVAMAGYSLNVQPVQMPIKNILLEGNICRLIISVESRT